MITGADVLTLRVKATSSSQKVDVIKLLASINGVTDVVCTGTVEPKTLDYQIFVEADIDVRALVINRLIEQGFSVLSLSSNELDLEQIFLRLTDENKKGDEE